VRGIDHFPQSGEDILIDLHIIGIESDRQRGFLGGFLRRRRLLFCCVQGRNRDFLIFYGSTIEGRFKIGPPSNLIARENEKKEASVEKKPKGVSMSEMHKKGRGC
jgi:hypothetical protein